MTAKGVHDTGVTEGEWDGPGAVAAMPNEAETLWYCHAWREARGDPDAKQSYKFPHHRTQGGPAVLNGVRNALARLGSANIPEGDRAGVERHLQAHLAKQEQEGKDLTPNPFPKREGEEDREVRSYHVEIRAEGGDGAPKIVGTAAVYNQPTVIETFSGSFVEQIEPGFFESVMTADVRALWNHNTDLVLGRTRAGTLTLVDRKEGLGIVVDPPTTSWGKDAIVSISRGDVDQMSFAFSVRAGGDEWKRDESGMMLRTLKRGGCAELYDVSPVTFPAYAQTSVGVRSVIQRFSEEASQRIDNDGDQVEGGTPDGEADQAVQNAETLAQAQRRVRAKNRKRKLEIKKRT